MEDYKRITLESYEKTIDSYNEKTRSLKEFDEPDKFSSYLKKDDLILDVGCGTGGNSEVLVNKGFKVIGIDLSKKIIEFAKNKIKNAEFLVMDMVELSFKDNYFDGIWARACFLHLKKEKVPKAVKESYRVLKKDGIMHVAVKEGKGERFISDKRYGGVEKFYSFFKKEEIEKILKDAGFKIIDSYINQHDKTHDTDPWINIFCKK